MRVLLAVLLVASCGSITAEATKSDAGDGRAAGGAAGMSSATAGRGGAGASTAGAAGASAAGAAGTSSAGGRGGAAGGAAGGPHVSRSMCDANFGWYITAPCGSAVEGSPCNQCGSTNGPIACVTSANVADRYWCVLNCADCQP
jgi:hypothetical protein